MGQYLIDTNAVSNYLTEEYSSDGMQLLDTIINEALNISVITKIELLSWKTNSETENIVRDFISDSNVFSLTDDITELCIDLRRKKNIKTPDAIIAATAIINNFTLVTGNEKDFQNIKKLKVINPSKL